MQVNTLRPIPCALVFGLLSASAGAEPAAAPAAGLAPKIDALVRRLAPAGARVAVHVRAVRDGAVLCARRDDAPFILASNTKLFTTAAAVDRLGPDFAWVTVLATRGERGADGILRGDLVVIGGGDPNISGRFHDGNPVAVFETWAADLGREGIREVAGDLVLDDTAFDREFYLAPWLDAYRADWYAAQVAALALNDNCLDLTLAPGRKPGDPIVVTTSPATAYVTLSVTARTVPGRGAGGLRIERAKGTNVIAISGPLGAEAAPGTHYATVHDPVLYFGTVLKETLERKGVPVRGRPRAVDPAAPPRAPPRHLTEHRSPLARDLAVINARSQNLHAEQLLKTLGWQAAGRGTREDGLAAVQAVLRRLALPDAVELHDGSGLARGNRTTARTVAALLAKMLYHPHASLFAGSLAVPGGEGSLRNRFAEDAYRGRVKAKTGYIGGVSALSGYLETRGGVLAAFSILVNDLPEGGVGQARDLQDAIVKAVIDGS